MNYSNKFENLLKQTYNNTKHVQYVPHAFLGILQEVIYNYEMDGKQKVPLKTITKCLESAVENNNKKEGTSF
ncbi:hypothetical protein [Bacillus sp. BPN334]|uniref:hypothetical protein n=1 Tax=Bacillus sp. BPN334 TaxID=2217815 RepID=UPI0011EDF5D3|nr:hypothetical protein [Bacillus sp. BPN334]KAA0781282.1 hypothetical protein DN393_30170 [Bacillus sp. BPN334]